MVGKVSRGIEYRRFCEQMSMRPRTVAINTSMITQ